MTLFLIDGNFLVRRKRRFCRIKIMIRELQLRVSMFLFTLRLWSQSSGKSRASGLVLGLASVHVPVVDSSHRNFGSGHLITKIG